jgi:hypothetical protein
MINKFSALCLLMVTPLAHGYTECQFTLTKVFTDGGGNFLIASGGYFNGYIPPSSPGYSPSVAAAIAARASDRPVVVRYQRDAVVCGSAPWDEVISGIGF